MVSSRKKEKERKTKAISYHIHCTLRGCHFEGPRDILVVNEALLVVERDWGGKARPESPDSKNRWQFDALVDEPPPPPHDDEDISATMTVAESLFPTLTVP